MGWVERMTQFKDKSSGKDAENISVGLFDEIGVAGTAWLRITLGAIGFVLIARPRYWRWTWRELRALYAEGAPLQ